uniref:Uncharacterized protein n=1 Tax=Phenylobacterium glaciei TaxID=2803784 RepID=A0A974P109_9CAUL|nr:hypothetical protein JKL49_19180 [Phenylobacterium glaciei]
MIGGVYQYHQTYDQPQGLRVLGDPSVQNPINLATGGPAAPNPEGNYLKVDGHLEVDSTPPSPRPTGSSPTPGS